MIWQPGLNRHLWTHEAQPNRKPLTDCNRWVKSPQFSGVTHFNWHFLCAPLQNRSLSLQGLTKSLNKRKPTDIDGAQQPYCATCRWFNMLNVLILLKRGKLNGSQRADGALDTTNTHSSCSSKFQMFSVPDGWLGARGFCTRLIKEQPRTKLKQAGAKGWLFFLFVVGSHSMDLCFLCSFFSSLRRAFTYKK